MYAYMYACMYACKYVYMLYACMHVCMYVQFCALAYAAKIGSAAGGARATPAGAGEKVCARIQ